MCRRSWWRDVCRRLSWVGGGSARWKETSFAFDMNEVREAANLLTHSVDCLALKDAMRWGTIVNWARVWELVIHETKNCTFVVTTKEIFFKLF